MTIAVYDHAPKPPASLDHATTITAVVELSKRTWLVGGHVPGLERRPLKRTEDRAAGLLRILTTWRKRAEQAGRTIARIVVAFEAGRDGFWLARWLRDRGINAYVMHATSVAISREHRRAKTDRIDTAMLRRGFLGWLRGERGHCSMALIPTIAEEDAKRPHRERESLIKQRTRAINQMKAILTQFGVRNFKPVLRKAAEKIGDVRTPEGGPLPANAAAALRRHIEHFRLINEQIKAIEKTRLQRLRQHPTDKFNTMVFLLVRIIGLGVETAEQLVHEILFRKLRDRKAVARYSGLTGAPDESGARRREKGLSRSGNGRVRKILIQLSWRMLRFQPNSGLVRWFKDRTANSRRSRKPMIVALARKLIIALWRYVNTGVVPEGFQLAK